MGFKTVYSTFGTEMADEPLSNCGVLIQTEPSHVLIENASSYRVDVAGI